MMINFDVFFFSIGVWLERTSFFIPDSNNSIQDSLVTITPPPPTSTPTSNPILHSASTPNLPATQKDTPTSSVKQPLLGAWGASNTTAAQIIKKNLSHNVLPSRPKTPGSRRGSVVTSESGGSTPQRYPSNTDLTITPMTNQENRWKPKDDPMLNRSRSSDERKSAEHSRQDRPAIRGRGQYGDGKKGGSYYRSVSDNSSARGRVRGRGGKGRGDGSRHPSSEPTNKRK